MLAAALTTLPHAASMVAPPNLALLQNQHNAIGQGNTTSSQPSPDDLTTQQVNNIQDATKLLPDHIGSFYTRGPDFPVNQVPPPGATPTSLLNSSDVFNDSVKLLQSQGGATSPAALLAAQAQIINATLQLSMYGQIASKASSGLQTMFNNPV